MYGVTGLLVRELALLSDIIDRLTSTLVSQATIAQVRVSARRCEIHGEEHEVQEKRYQRLVQNKFRVTIGIVSQVYFHSGQACKPVNPPILSVKLMHRKQESPRNIVHGLGTLQ